MIDAKIIIEKYNPNWPTLFADEQARLIALIGDDIDGTIEHVGSTAVRGLAAKPIIDIMVGVKSLSAATHLIDILVASGYCYYPHKADVMHWFCKPTPEIRTHHLHLVPYQSPLWHERITFRDALRADPNLAAQYQTLKYQLANKFSDQREHYTQQKWPFIQRVLTGVEHD
ncbi:GrpB family protein [Colwelliaceae bacterium 6441]